MKFFHLWPSDTVFESFGLRTHPPTARAAHTPSDSALTAVPEHPPPPLLIAPSIDACDARAVRCEAIFRDLESGRRTITREIRGQPRCTGSCRRAGGGEIAVDEGAAAVFADSGVCVADAGEDGGAGTGVHDVLDPLAVGGGVAGDGGEHDAQPDVGDSLGGRARFGADGEAVAAGAGGTPGLCLRRGGPGPAGGGGDREVGFTADESDWVVAGAVAGRWRGGSGRRGDGDDARAIMVSISLVGGIASAAPHPRPFPSAMRPATLSLRSRRQLCRPLRRLVPTHAPFPRRKAAGYCSFSVLRRPSAAAIMQETLHLLSIPGMRASIRKG